MHVADYGNLRVQKFDSNGRFLAEGDGDTGDAAESFAPPGIAIGSNGNVGVNFFDKIAAAVF